MMCIEMHENIIILFLAVEIGCKLNLIGVIDSSVPVSYKELTEIGRSSEFLSLTRCRADSCNETLSGNESIGVFDVVSGFDLKIIVAVSARNFIDGSLAVHLCLAEIGSICIPSLGFSYGIVEPAAVQGALYAAPDIIAAYDRAFFKGDSHIVGKRAVIPYAYIDIGRSGSRGLIYDAAYRIHVV